VREFILNCTVIEIMLAGIVFFFSIYLLFGCFNWFLTHQLLPYFGIGQRLDPRPLGVGQLKREFGLSLMSILIFGLGMIFPWGLLHLGWARLAIDPSLVQTLLEILVLIVWNEIHFYINHRLLHTRLLRQFHLPHHRSVVTTPWSAYSFHPIEAAMLGNVILLPMLVHDFSVHALFAVPLFSLLFNSIGHSNFDFNPRSPRVIFNGARRHHLHHACFHGNYGFMFPFMDWLGKTALPADAAAKQLTQWESKRSDA
jgi:Delta7-sterol 5-desaturase